VQPPDVETHGVFLHHILDQFRSQALRGTAKLQFGSESVLDIRKVKMTLAIGIKNYGSGYLHPENRRIKILTSMLHPQSFASHQESAMYFGTDA
jgi:hypothetical protein